ncbi:hypothetical protein BC826DRAFT_392003 [Russula brevipes]|nr:hypothetical protein BC826DRAFT_392003 [Russula brevipes]
MCPTSTSPCFGVFPRFITKIRSASGALTACDSRPPISHVCHLQAASPTSDDPNGARQPHGSRPTIPFAAAPSHPVQAPLVPPSDSSLTDLMDHDTSPVPLPFSRAASSALSALDSTPPTPRDGRLLSALHPPRRLPSSGKKLNLYFLSRPTRAQASSATPLLPTRNPIRMRGPRLRLPHRMGTCPHKAASQELGLGREALARPQKAASAARADEPASALPPVPASPPRASSSSSTTAISATASFLSPSPTANPDRPDAEDDQPCPHPTLLGTLIEALALSRASSLPLATLTRTTPALADYPHAVLTSTLAWAVRSRILGCVHSSGEALPPSYFYDPATDPDCERGELLRCLMPRAGKRRETMKYKQYYWAPVVVGRGRTRTWDVDWDE